MSVVKTNSFVYLMLIILSITSAPSWAKDDGIRSYRVNPGDILQIYVWNEENLTREILVQPDGAIRYPLVGEVMAGGNLLSYTENKVREGLQKFLKEDPVVTVSLKSAVGSKIYVIGNVNRPGEYPVSGHIDVVQAIALAGGFNAFAAEKDIRILWRAEDGSQSSTEFSYADIKNGRALESNKLLNSGDTVIVP